MISPVRDLFDLMIGARGLPIVCVLVAALSGSVVVASAAPAASVVPRPVMDYASLLQQVNRSASPAAIESLFTLGMRAADSLQRSMGSAASPLELMDDSTLAEVERRMEGFTVLRTEEFSSAGCRPAFFLALAQSHGDSADVAFFHALAATCDSTDRPVYVQQQTDVSGCTRFGSGTLVATFDAWRSFVSRHPGRYADRAHDQMRRLEDELTGSTCPCGDRESVLRELRLFVRRFPDAAITPQVRARLRAVQAGTAGMRYPCIAG